MPVRTCEGPGLAVPGTSYSGVVRRSVLLLRLLAQGIEVIEAAAVLAFPAKNEAVVIGAGIAASGALGQGCKGYPDAWTILMMMPW